MGHANNWKGYLAAIRDNDEKEWELWKFLQSDPFYKDKTAYFVTNDHGRHLDGVANGFIDHGDNCEGCRHIFLFAAGPDFKKNTVVDHKREQIDIAATTASLLGFTIPGSKGKLMSELFTAPSSKKVKKKKVPVEASKP
jgi:arylsulfatase A-like enzyme